jgi:hypothetical protein
MLIKTAISEIRRGLGRPHDAQLGDPDILMELWQVVTYYRSRLMLTPEPWDIKRETVTVPNGTTRELDLSITDFGEAFLIRTEDDGSNPYFIARTVDVIRPEQMSQYWAGPEALLVGGSWWTPHVAVAMSIFNEEGQLKLMWAPAHQESADYTIWYVRGAATVPPLMDDTTEFPMEEQNWYIIADCIINLMPHLADEKMGLNMKQQALIGTAEKKMKQWEPVFYARLLDGPRSETTQRRKIFGQSRSSARGLGRR